jgi:hypothetical protein
MSNQENHNATELKTDAESVRVEALVRRRIELCKGMKLIRRGENWTAEVLDWNFASNTIEMKVENKIGNGWVETWNLEHTLVGLQRGDYRYAA